jgi:hypothetical protein
MNGIALNERLMIKDCVLRDALVTVGRAVYFHSDELEQAG